MPAAFGNKASEEGQGLALVGVPSVDAYIALYRQHAQLQRDRTIPDEELESIVELSEKTQVYIYSVGAWPQPIALASLGSRWVPALPEEKVLVANDFSVAGPLLITGVPSEPYPMEAGAIRIYHKPKKGDSLRRHTGLHLAMEAIGAGARSKNDYDLRPFGLFVSLVPEQPLVENEADRPRYSKWKLSLGTSWKVTLPPQPLWSHYWEDIVNLAKKALRTKFSADCARATQAWKRGGFGNEFVGNGSTEEGKIFIEARILKKTKVECPWLENTEASNDNKMCIAECGTILPINALKCSACGTLQVTQEKFDAELKRRQSLVK